MSARAWRARRPGAYSAEGKLAKRIIKTARVEMAEGIDPSGCPYYRYYTGRGPQASCNRGCYQEPSCVTDQPIVGWPSDRLREPNKVARWLINLNDPDLTEEATTPDV